MEGKARMKVNNKFKCRGIVSEGEQRANGDYKEGKGRGRDIENKGKN